MSVYTPDAWVIVRIASLTTGNETDKVLAGWYGGFAGSDSWKLNSGITKITLDGECYEIAGHSGSVYRCYKHNERMSGLMAGVLASFKKDLEGTGTIEVINISDILESYK